MPVGLPVVLSFQLRNSGSRELQVTDVYADSGGAGPFQVSATAMIVPPAETTRIDVTFLPQAEGVVTATLHVRSDAQNNPDARVTLSGEGVARTVCAPCDSPPASYCTPGNALIAYELTGACVNGRCQYQATTIDCLGQCSEATCVAPVDGGTDAGFDGGFDAGFDGGIDAGAQDAGVPDAGSADDGGCPGGLDPRPDLNANGVADCRENLLANGQFRTSTAPWASTFRAQIQFSSADELGSATSGSGLVNNIVNATTQNGGGANSECVPVSPSTTYKIYLRYRMPSGQPGGDANNAAWTTVQLYSDASCSVPSSGQSGGMLGTVKNAWSPYTRTVITAAGEQSLFVSLGVLKGATTSAVYAEFDNVLLIRE